GEVIVRQPPKRIPPSFLEITRKPIVERVSPFTIQEVLGVRKAPPLEIQARLKALLKFEAKKGIIKIPTKEGFRIVDIKKGKTLIEVRKDVGKEFKQLKAFEKAEEIRGQPFKKKPEIKRELREAGFREVPLGQGQVAVQILKPQKLKAVSKPKVKFKEITKPKVEVGTKARQAMRERLEAEQLRQAFEKRRKGIFVFEKVVPKTRLGLGVFPIPVFAGLTKAQQEAKTRAEARERARVMVETKLV
ncbi:unnamed protein product, partial [marine sediment metagenome]